MDRCPILLLSCVLCCLPTIGCAPSGPQKRALVPSNAPDVKPFEYVEADIAFYPVGEGYVGDGHWNRMQLPLSAEQSMKRIVVPEGFRVELFAAEPDIGKAICMNWDERGRLWIAETVDYPNNLQPEGEGRDRIRICEDTDGDGRADKFTVFADKLSIPTSMAFAYGGVIVHQAPVTLFLKDTDGDNKADTKQVLISGWGTDDTHAGPSNLNYGPDNWFYGMVGYSGFKGKIAGKKYVFGQGFYRFQLAAASGKVELTDFEFLRSTDNNSWGLGFSEEGILFGSTANRNPSVYMPIPNRYYERVRGWTSNVLASIADTHLFQPITDGVRQVDHHGGYTAAAGHALYTARTYPREYWNRAAFVAEPTGHLVGTFVLSRQGADFQSTNPFNLLASDDEWCAPIAAEVGPDGNVWVIDWYNYIVQHNPIPAGFKKGKGNAYITKLRDKKHGRIYRVVYDRSQSRPTLDGSTSPGSPNSGEFSHDTISLHDATPSQLVSALSNSNMFWRRHAQRLLVERGKQDVVPQLLELVRNQQVDEIGLNVGAIHALRTLDGLGVFAAAEPGATDALVTALKHTSPTVARTATTVLPHSDGGLSQLLESGVLAHDDAQVRLAAILALSDMPNSAESAAAVLGFLDDPRNANDGWLTDAATSAAARSAQPFLVALTHVEQPEAGLLELACIVAEHQARSGDAESFPELLKSLTAAAPATSAAIVSGLTAGWPKTHPLHVDDETEQLLIAILDRTTPAAQGQLLRLAATWGSQRLAKQHQAVSDSLLTKLQDTNTGDAERIEAAKLLIGLWDDDDKVVDDVLQVISPQTSPDVSRGILDALVMSRSKTLGSAILSHVDRFAPSARNAAIRVMLARSESIALLLEGIKNGDLSLTDLALDQQQALLSHPDAAIRHAADKVFHEFDGLANADRQQVLESLLPLVTRTGNVEHGKAVFTKNCATCHTYRGEGQQVGPDLTGMAVHPKAELLTNIVDPSRSVEGNYRVYTVATLDGLVLTGMLAAETQTAIELVDSQAKRRVVLREDIDALIASNKSVMPEGFEKQIDEQGFTDLLEYLTAREVVAPRD